MKSVLKQRLESKDAVIGIIGLGYVGLPLVIRFSDVGFKVLGFDINEPRCEQLNRGESFIKHIPSEKIASSLGRGFEATTDFSRSAEADALLICVPTPLTAHREPDMTYIHKTMLSLKEYLREGQVLALESTTYPGTTNEELRPYIEERGLVIGENFFLVYSPEREDPGNPDFETRTIPKVCGGETPACLEVGVSLYESVIDKVVPVSSTQTAEMVKLLENIHRAVNIGLVNEMKIVADRMGIDIHEVIRAAATKPFGFTPYYPGPGLGGHCIPIDPFYLTWKAREYDVHTRFIELAGEVNTSMPDYVISKVADGLNQRGRAVKDSRILILGLSYKKNVDDDRESPSVVLMDKLMKKGAHVDYADPYIPKFRKMRRYDFDKADVGTSPETLKSYDCVLIATNHDAFDYAQIYEYSPLIIDTRGIYSTPSPKIIKA